MIRLALAAAALLAAAPARELATRLEVPALRQSRERCGPTALRMVLGYWGAPDTALAIAERAYDPLLRGALITDLARAAREAGFDAVIRTLPPDTIPALLAGGQPPVLLYRNGPAALGPRHFGVVVGYDPARLEYDVLDGSGPAHVMGRDELERRWRAGGGWALLVSPRPAGTGAP